MNLHQRIFKILCHKTLPLTKEGHSNSNNNVMLKLDSWPDFV